MDRSEFYARQQRRDRVWNWIFAAQVIAVSLLIAAKIYRAIYPV